MPQFLEAPLRASAAKHGFTGRKADEYVYGAMNNLHVMRGNRITAHGKALQAKHERDMKTRKKKSKLHGMTERGQ